jgi:predicted CXXCH cytochrome family protein
LLFLVLTFASAYAITGQCSNCHTMHNSQNGIGEVKTYSTGSLLLYQATPQSQLLKASCIACHAGATGETGEKNSFGAPIVLHTSPPGGQGAGYTLAGGDFYWVSTNLGATDSKGHNVSGLAEADTAIFTNIGNNPPGWDKNATNGFTFGQVADGEDNWSTQLTCDGIYGCHGQHNSSGITSAHHNNTNLTATQASSPTTVGGSYRFLAGIKGLENSDWNWTENSSTHNEYYGVNDTSNRNQSNTAYLNKDTISFSCAECHGYFHSHIDDTTTGSPWLRHPTDVALPATGEYSDYNPDSSNQYSVEAPVARPNVPANPSPIVTPGTDIVMCLSCHRAHGSPEPDLLRWTYSGMVAGSGTSDTGCFTCHTCKNADCNIP